jgi:hypothetical protein
MRWDQLPKEIKEKMLERQAEQNEGFVDATVFIKDIEADKEEGGFNWYITPEENYFWCQVLHFVDFEHFYEKYPKKESVVVATEPCKVTSERLVDEDKIWYNDVIDLGFEIESVEDNVYFKKYGFPYNTVLLDCPKGISFDYERESPGQVKMVRSDEYGRIIATMLVTSLKELKSFVKFFKAK